MTNITLLNFWGYPVGLVTITLIVTIIVELLLLDGDIDLQILRKPRKSR